MEKKKLSRSDLEYYARMAAKTYLDDPVHTYATKDRTRREKFLYHFMIERLSSSNKVDYIFEDEERRGLCVWREAHNEYTMFDFLKCPNWVFLPLYPSSLIKTLGAYSHLDCKVFDKNTLIISPVFVSAEHKGKGIGTALIKSSMEQLLPLGCKFGLEAQNPENVAFYEKLGFKTIKHDRWEREGIDNYYMVFDPSKKDKA